MHLGNMRITYDTQTRQFSISRGDVENRFYSQSQELVHNLLRIICRPKCSSTNHWLGECYPFLKVTLGVKLEVKRKPIEYLFGDHASYKNSPKKFYLEKDQLYDFYKDVVSEPYGIYRDLTSNQVCFCLWIFYSMIDPMKPRHSKDEIIQLLNEWYRVIHLSPEDWIDNCNVTYKDLRAFSEQVRYKFTLNI